MKWGDYNRMNNRQKEEYDYKFKNRPICISIAGVTFTVVTIFLLLDLMLFTTYLVITDDRFAAYESDVIDILKGASNLAVASLSVVGVIVLFYIFDLFYRHYSERKWIKQNGIRITHVNVLVKMLSSRR